ELITFEVAVPALVIGELLVCRAGEQDAGACVARIAADTLVQRPPDAQRLRHQRHFARIAPRDAHPAPVAAGLLVPDASLLAKRDAKPALGEFQRCGRPDDAAAYDDDIDFFRQFGVAMDGDYIGTGHFSMILPTGS